MQNKTLPNKGILLNGVLKPKLPNNLFTSCFSINFDFILAHIAQFDNIIVLSLLVPKIFGLCFLYFFCTLNNKITLLYTYAFYLIILSIPFLLLSSIKLFFPVSLV